MKKVTLGTIIRDMSGINGKKYSENAQVVNLFLEVVKDYLKQGQKVYLAHFGTIGLRLVPGRRIYIPPTKSYSNSKPKKKLVIGTAADFHK